MISAKIIADSKNKFGNRITTMIVTFPRIILAEFNTHRMFSRNSASSRAIPFDKMVKSIEENPFIPMAWQKDHKGMQGTEYFSSEDSEQLVYDWLIASKSAVEHAKGLQSDLNNGGKVTKQLANRLLEPFMYHTVIVTATEWENFFALRCPKYELPIHSTDGGEEGISIFRSKKDLRNNAIFKYYTKEYQDNFDFIKANKGQAEIHMMALAEAMWDAYNESTPRELKAGEWHIPFEDKLNVQKIENIAIGLYDMIAIGNDDVDPNYNDYIREQIEEIKIKISTVMCARVSYTTIDTEQSEWNYDKYIAKHDELINARPIHASPLEHCAKAMSKEEYYGMPFYGGNFKGFYQYRKMIPNENITSNK